MRRQLILPLLSLDYTTTVLLCLLPLLTHYTCTQDYVSVPAGKPAKPSEALARETLTLLKRRHEPEAAVLALQEAGLMRLHDPVPVLRLGHTAEGDDFSQKLQQAAQVRITTTTTPSSFLFAPCVCGRITQITCSCGWDFPLRQAVQLCWAAVGLCWQLGCQHVLYNVILQALMSSPPEDRDAPNRLDLTHLEVYTIDDASTRDVDDGVSLERGSDGQLLLWVHVADPTRWLQPGACMMCCAEGHTHHEDSICRPLQGCLLCCSLKALCVGYSGWCIWYITKAQR